MQRHSIMGGKIHLFKRPRSPYWQCTAYLKGRERRKSSKQKSLTLAKEFAEDWYLGLRDKSRNGQLVTGRTFAQAAKKFNAEYASINAGHRSAKWVQGHQDRLRLHILPFMGHLPLNDMPKGIGQDYRVHRMTQPKDWYDRQEKLWQKKYSSAQQQRENPFVPKAWKPPAKKTIHNEVVTMNLVFKTAHIHGWIDALPNLSNPYSRQTKVEHRPWFTPKEYQKFYEATRENAQNPKHPRYKWYAEQLHDYVLFMANTGLRPDEAKRLEFRDVEVVEDDMTGETILEIEVRGKRGTGYCKSMPGAVFPFKRLRDRIKLKKSKDEADERPHETDLVFPNEFKKMLNGILNDIGLKFDRNGKARTSYSLRHSYICFRLLEGADIYQIAKNCRTSVEMIEKHYAAHLKDMIDASLVNVRKAKTMKIKQEG